jgi:hypothetical protein
VTTPSRYATTSAASRQCRVPDRHHARVAALLDLDVDEVRAALDGFDATLRRREEQRRAATRELVAELYARDGVNPAPGRVDAEAEAACAQERDERLAAELRRLVTPGVAAVRRARTLSDRELDRDCQAALSVLATAPRSLAEFGLQAEQRHAAEQAVLDGYVRREAEVAGQLEEVRGWRRHRRRRLSRELADAARGCAAAEHRVRASAVRLAALQLRAEQRAEWLAQPEVQEVLGAGAAALRELADRAQAPDATAELPALDQPVTPGAAR